MEIENSNVEAQKSTLAIAQIEKAGVRPYDAIRLRRLRHKIDLRLMPIFAWVYLLNYLDRSNIGNAKILNRETGDSFLQSFHMTTNDYAVTITVFAVAYSLFDVPANFALKRFFRPSIWFGLLFFCWGVLTLSFAWLKNYASVLVIRFLIGVSRQASILVPMHTLEMRQEERSVRIAFFSASTTLAGAFGGCVAYGVGFINGHSGLKGWQWLFVIEGLITILSTLILIVYLPDYPSTAKWLTEEERELVQQGLEEQNSSFTREPASRREILQALSPRMVVHYVAFFLDVIVFASLSYFSPTIVNGLGYASVKAQLMTVPPWCVGFVVSLCLAWSADHFNARGYHAAGASMLSGIGFMTSAVLPADAYLQRYGALILASAGAFPTLAPLAGWVTCNAPSQRTIGLAAGLNSAGVGLASIVAAWIWRGSEAAAGFPTGNKVCAVCSFVCAVLALGLRWEYGRLNRQAKEAVDGVQRVWLY
ncbi:uncharacterized protein A1O9_03696 [Exophiala aquamarina CBS 119918]|uniref:Major facilitator superfamily (MFS) profile domain-containing protein n=1 Tax=Exophiala aquamarina CBS 119918 TaxID=1182545 RepID=A0A072PHS8_9EURO|nr:uncharacterized protein A1O9_03696 [Exophiala aquamarina CBS 119918]KEF58853.1 hypothetical protein A1O9_03696 [Exophiala aquamarina CBS 119918]